MTDMHNWYRIMPFLTDSKFKTFLQANSQTFRPLIAIIYRQMYDKTGQIK